MAIIKCKMCGGDMELSADNTFGTCEYCGCTTTLPKVDDEQRVAAFNRGNHFRRIGDFDKALSIYERIVEEDDTDAEAHWCCALCRFGIEYVEDPATLEWIPTCHRASFDSFLEDLDYLAALEHSDGVTQRQYQKDAAKIAEVQHGILVASQNEEPFDVFICYKESDENKNRTIDSALAQDIYYQLTEQGRRVFFARLTLEDKVGSEYEPYIFSALNSAKVMLVVGTKPEYFNAVWVKNEWSRFLALMKKDHQKLILPCYRDMDPYDLPEQLSMLQAYDMSKIGFIQDLIRGIAKVLDADKPAVQPGTVVIQQSGADNIEYLLKRGHLALEDGDWNKADEFFENVLNQDSECAEAYAGKSLARNRAKDLDTYITQALAEKQKPSGVKLLAGKPDEARVKSAVSRYMRPGYVTREEIQQLYYYNFAFDSAFAGKEEQNQQAKQAFEKTFNLAFRFAKGAFKTKLEQARKHYFDALDAQLIAAQRADENTAAAISGKYQKHLDEADRRAAQLYQQAEKKQEGEFRQICRQQAEAKTVKEYMDVASAFDAFGPFSDSESRAKFCRSRAKRIKHVSSLFALLISILYLFISPVPKIVIPDAELHWSVQGLLMIMPIIAYFALLWVFWKAHLCETSVFGWPFGFFFLSVIADAIIFSLTVPHWIVSTIINKVLQGVVGLVLFGIAPSDSEDSEESEEQEQSD